MATEKPICVFGVMSNENGLRIAKEMREWLAPVYELHEVLHDGSQFELPALLEAQRLAKETGRPVLYIHTRGAVNEWRTTIPTRKMWKEEFGVQWRKYFLIADITETPLVVCPFTDYDKETRYNGFVANAPAWAQLDLQPSEDRMVYEKLWCHHSTPVIGMLISREDHAIKDIRKYLYKNYED